jgi:cell wall-associated NlpC family hydrolase
MAALPDRRTHAYRPDLADERLRGLVEAQSFVAGQPGQVRTALVPVYLEPRFDAARETEAQAGERVRIFDRAGGWAWVQLEADSYVGYVPETAVASSVRETTHRVSALATFLFQGPDIKSEVMATFAMNAAVSAVEAKDRFLRLQTGGYVVARHLALAGEAADDFVAVAERFIGTPYLWGGKTSAGLDCSGLVQTAMTAAGLAAPRDTDMQQVAIGRTLQVGQDLAGLRRGDLVFWKGHVGIVTDGLHLLHANAHHMEVVREPLHAAVARIAATGSPIAAVKRPDALGARPATA